MTIRRTPKNMARNAARRYKQGFSAKVRHLGCLRSHGRCEVDDCGPADHYHHRGPRGSGGTSLSWVNEVANLLHVARACHERIESDRTLSYFHGWLVARNGPRIAADVPVLRRDEWVLLADDGSFRPVGGEA